MSRAYRISVRESLRRVLRAHDRVSTQLELLEILSPEEMAELLSLELEKGGFERKDGELVREQDGVKVSVDPNTGTVTVSAESSQDGGGVRWSCPCPRAGPAIPVWRGHSARDACAGRGHAGPCGDNPPAGNPLTRDTLGNSPAVGVGKLGS